MFLRSRSSTSAGRGGFGTPGRKRRKKKKEEEVGTTGRLRFPEVLEMLDSLWSTAAFLNITVRSLNDSITHSNLNINIFSSQECIDMR